LTLLEINILLTLFRYLHLQAICSFDTANISTEEPAVPRHIFVIVVLLFAYGIASAPILAAQASENSSPSVNPVDVSGKWQVSWQGRLGTEQCTLQLQQDSSNKLQGTLLDQRGSSSLTGTVDGKKISFDVQFQGPRPFTTRFTGTVDADKIEGTSQAIGVGGTGAYLGHGGEVAQPEHPWTAKRVPNSANPSPQTGSNPNPSSRN
jgi:hypothetical protein